jgi:DNA (cytosine-5)-methyltransferase 1
VIEIVVDNFAGGGGASTGIEAALGRPIDYAVNHDRFAVAMHVKPMATQSAALQTGSRR